GGGGEGEGRVVGRELAVVDAGRQGDRAGGGVGDLHAVMDEARRAGTDAIVVERDVDVLRLPPVHVLAVVVDRQQGEHVGRRIEAPRRIQDPAAGEPRPGG